MEIGIRLKNGVIYSASVDSTKGSPRNPLSPGELEEKFHQCCQGRLTEAEIRRILHQVRHFEQLKDVADLIDLGSGV